MREGWNFDHSYATLPGIFFRRIPPEKTPAPALAILNHRLAEQLGLDPDALAGEQGSALFSGNRLPGSNWSNFRHRTTATSWRMSSASARQYTKARMYA
jgi:uncharacterized protein YdiU (UPF0061 family)